MQFQQVFDANTVEPASFSPPPPLADYHVRIIESEAKPTKDNTGGYLSLTLEILDPGPYQGRKIPYNLNLFHANPQTIEIAYRQLSAVCHVTKTFQIQDSRQLHGIPFIANIGPQANNPQYANVFGVKDINGALPGKAGQAAPAAFPVAAAPAPTAAPPAWGPPAPMAPPAAAPVAPRVWGQPEASQPPPAAPAPAWGPPAAAAPPAWSPQAAAPPQAPPWVK